MVYAKRPFSSPGQVIEYLGRYTHGVAISNWRIQGISDTSVRFSYTDRSDGNKKKVMCLTGEKFLGRFMLHILPLGFTRIRHYGFLSPRNKTKSLTIIRKFFKVITHVRKKLAWSDIVLLRWGFNPLLCPHCGGTLVVFTIIPKQRAPPLPLIASRNKAIKNFHKVG